MAQKEVHLRDYLAVIRNHDFIILVSFLIILGSALAVGLRISKTYEASALILVHPNANANVPSDNLFQSVLSGGANRTEMETISRRFSTESLVKSVIDSFEQSGMKGAIYLPSVSSLKNRIRAKIVPDTRFIKVSVRMKEQEGGERNAAIFVNRLIENLQNVLNEEQSSEAQYRMFVVDKELNGLKANLSKQQQKLLDFMRQNGLPNLWYERLSQALIERRNLAERKYQAAAALSDSKLELDKIHEELKNYPELIEYSRTISDNPLWVEQITALSDVESRIADTKARLGPESPELKGLEAQKHQRESNLKSLVDKTTSSITQTLSPTYLSLLERKITAEINRIRLERRFQQYDVRLEKIDEKLAQLISSIPEKQFIFDQLTNEISSLYGINQELYKQKIDAQILMGKSEYSSSNLNSNRPKGGIFVVDEAQPQRIPISPRIFFIAAVAAIAGVSVGLAIAFMFEYFDNTYHSPQEVKNDLEIPLLGSIPTMKSEKRDIFALPMEDEPTSKIAESYRSLATNIGFACYGMENQAIMITNSNPGETKSYDQVTTRLRRLPVRSTQTGEERRGRQAKPSAFLAANLAIAIAQAKGPVIVMDCDLRHSMQHKIFGLYEQSSNISVGLSNLLIDDVQIDEAITNTQIPNLDLIVSGPIPPNPSNLLNSPKIEKIIEYLKSSYNTIICDAPSMCTSDALVLASKLDGTILAVDLEETSRDVISRDIEQLSRPGVNLLGIVCIGRDYV